jgi:hypothetical protein
MLPRRTLRNPAVASYYTMRRAVGLIALTLPFALASGSILTALLAPAHALPHPLLQRSISDYYYTPMRDYYVGALCAIGAFLMSSRGYDLIDEITGYLAGFLAFGVAFSPSFDPRGTRYTQLDVDFGYLHTVFAALMFLTLSCICIFRFSKTAPGKAVTHSKRNRNRLYASCGYIMIVCMGVMVGLTVHTTLERRHPSHWLFWFEALALGAFGVAWLTKGAGMLRDKTRGHLHHAVPRSAVQET